MQKAPSKNTASRGPAAYSPQPIARSAFTLLETMLVITIIAILFVALEPTYQAFQVRAQLTDATDRTRQVLERAKTLALSGYRTPGTEPDMLIVDIDKSRPANDQIRLCSQKFDPSVMPTVGQLKPCTNASLLIDSVALGSIRVRTPVSQLLGFVPPFGSSVTNGGKLEITLSAGDSPTAKSSLVRLTSSTNRIEVNPPSPTP